MATEGLGFEITELRLGLPGGSPITASKNNEKKRVFSELEKVEDSKSSHGGGDDGRRRKQMVGWPPVCSYRRRNSFKEKEECESEGNIMGKKIKKYVKVSFEGAPFLRKVDLGMVKGYGDLVGAMEKLFGSPIGCSEFTLTYEDRDGDWMLVGDVPWKMFTESCKRLRIMKKTEAKRSEATSSLSQYSAFFNGSFPNIE